jgi:NitT/TauT family transport system substrate-binding protein
MNSFRSRLLVASFVVASTVVALSGCGGTDAGTPLDSGTVTIGTLRGQPHFYRPFLYEDFAADGLSYEIVTLDTAPALNDALISGAVDFAITGVTTTISSIAQDRELKIIASAADGGSGFIGNDTVDTLDDLVGATAGYIQGSAQEVVMRLILADAGIDPADLDLMVVPVHDMANAFATGSVDAFFGVEIGASIALQNGGHELADVYDTPIGNVNIGLVTTQELLDSDP